MVQEHVDRLEDHKLASDTEWLTRNIQLVNIMDSIMFEAQRQGRLSFYMVKLLTS
jgi:hypothetical protein